MLNQINIFGKTKLEATLERVKAFEPEDGYWLAFSGGKDSQCIYELAKLAGVKFEAHYNITSVDPPELIYFIREQYPDVVIDKPRYNDGKQITMWRLIANETMPPTRIARYCCEKLKESSGSGRVTMTGVRWAESANRRTNQGLVTIYGKSKTTQKELEKIGADFTQTPKGGVILNLDNAEARRSVEICYRTRRTIVNPIIDWDDSDVWEFLNEIVKVPHCCLYDRGYKRIGCIGCPMGGEIGMAKEFARYPKYKNLYIKAFEQMVKNHPEKIRIATGETVNEKAKSIMKWWLKEDEKY